MDTSDSQAAAPENGEAQTQDTSVTEQNSEAQVNWENRAKELEAEVAKFKRIAERNAKKAERTDDKTDSKESKHSAQSDGLLDWGTKAYLRTEGIEATEFDFVEEQMEMSGLSLEKLITNPYFKSQLQERRDQKSAEAASPGKSRGSTESGKTKVDYWIERSDLPPNTPENKKLRADIVEARYQRSKGVYGL
jgi:hypothetical protein